MNNKVKISGTINGNTIISKRTSGVEDTIQIDMQLPSYAHLTLHGEFRSENTPDRHCKLFVHVTEVTPPEENVNEVILTGYVCRTPTHRFTPAGKEITDILIAVNRNKYETDYIPVVAWGKQPELKIGNKITVEGRLQSRTYKETHTAYEVSAKTITLTN